MIRKLSDMPETAVEGQVPPRLRDSFTIRVKEATFGPSKNSGQPLITWNCEIVDPLSYKASDGKTYAMDTLKVTYYLPLGEKMLRTVLDMLKRLGFPDEIDDENPRTDIYEGIQFFAVLSSEEDKVMRQDESGKYVPILDQDGKELQGRWKLNCDLRQILHPSIKQFDSPST